METKSHQRYHDEDGRNTALLTIELGFFNGRFDGRGAAQAPELMHGRRGVGAFRGCALLCIVIPPAIRTIKARGYRDCSGLTTVILNNWLEEIGVWALDECRSLVHAKIPLGIRAASSPPAAPMADAVDSYNGPPITALDIRAGRITRVWSHEGSEKLFCEEINVGKAEPRLVASGLRPYMSAEDLDGRLVLVLCNLKERKLAGFPSHGMVLCASSEDRTAVRLVGVPVDARVGERVTVPGVVDVSEGAAPFAENKIGKQKVFEKIAPFLRTGKYGVPEFCGRPLLTSAGVCTSPITNGSVS